MDGHRGEITHIGLLTFSMSEIEGWLSTQTPTGKIVTIPNSFVFEKAFSNETADFPYVWKDLTLPITHASNVSKAEEILLDAARGQLDTLVADTEEQDREKLTEQADMFDSTIEPTVNMRVHGSGGDLFLRYLAPYDGIAAVETRLWKDIFTRIDGVDDIEYSPTVYRLVTSPPANPYQ
ncbi:mechanosensitive ion channel domain-containing protein [Mobiluncus sp.]|uniref:mechanosensitive ion channel domain-containing protein n=1 Tax=Mobiluncus sp. TaxID=47293 RepID=UPI002A9178C8|nr:mechanosensitive ion channel domain-containing protein [Mobiluncus sp.]MDY6077109.1 mechanosensitive ion channel [Mobiluncus sp.]